MTSIVSISPSARTSGGSDFKTCPWEEELCDFLQYEVYYRFLREERPLATSEEPVQHGKSTKLRLFVCWLIGLHSDLKFNFYTASDKLRNETQLFVTSVLESQAYCRLFSHLIKNYGAETTRFWRGGQIDYRLMGEGNTGYSSHISIIDDPYRNSDDANSQTMREKIENRFRGDVLSRRQSLSMVIVMHSRWHVSDLIGTLKMDDYFKSLLLSSRHPALGEDGIALFPALRDEKFLSEQRRALGNSNFEALYQQNPIISGGNLIKTQWFQYYEKLPKLSSLRIYADTAMSQKTTGDYTVLQLWGRDSVDLNSNYYLVDQIRGKWDADELLTRAQAFYSKANALQKNLRCSALCVEARANGLVLLQQLRRRKIPVIELEASRDKILRAQDALPTIASGYVLLPRGAEFLSDLLREIEAFPASDHDDQVDAMVYAINDRQLTVDLAATL